MLKILVSLYCPAFENMAIAKELIEKLQKDILQWEGYSPPSSGTCGV